jgi:hypothetical protein
MANAAEVPRGKIKTGMAVQGNTDLIKYLGVFCRKAALFNHRLHCLFAITYKTEPSCQALKDRKNGKVTEAFTAYHSGKPFDNK